MNKGLCWKLDSVIDSFPLTNCLFDLLLFSCFISATMIHMIIYLQFKSKKTKNIFVKWWIIKMSLASGRCILVPPDLCGRCITNWAEVPRSSHIQIWHHKPRLRRGNAKPYMKLRFTNYQTSVSPFNIEIYLENKGAPQDSVLPTALLSYLTFFTWDFGQIEKLPLSTKYYMY